MVETKNSTIRIKEIAAAVFISTLALSSVVVGLKAFSFESEKIQGYFLRRTSGMYAHAGSDS